MEKIFMEECKNTNCSKCEHFAAYYTKEVDRYVLSKFGWCYKKHEHIFKNNVCTNFAKRAVNNDKLNTEQCLDKILDELTEIRNILVAEK